MSEGKRFTCPSCGSSLSPSGDAAQVKCDYCATSVIVPPELRSAPPPTRLVPAATLDSESAHSSSGCGKGIVLVLLVPILLCGIGAAIFMAQPERSFDLPIAKISPTPAGPFRVVLSFGGEGTSPGLFQDPRYLAVDPDGMLYVADYKTRRVQRFDPNGKFINGWTVDEGLCSNKSATFNNMAADPAGNVYVSFCGLIAKYEGATGKLLDTFNRTRGASSDFYMSVEAIPGGDLLVVASGATPAREVVLRLDATGKVLARLPNLVSDHAESSANAMTIRAVADGLGNLFVLNKDDYYIYKFTREGRYVNKFGGAGNRPGQFETWAHALALDNQSRLYITDFDGIKVLDANGAYLDQSKDRILNGATELRIDAHNGIYFIGKNSTVFKLEWNGT